MPHPKISAFVISYNRATILGTCLRGLAFADELIVVDKSSTDGSRAIADAHADRVITVPWTPTVEETRTLALSLCRHEWILFMDDDECLSPEASDRIRAGLGNLRGTSMPSRCVTTSSACTTNAPTTGPSIVSGCCAAGFVFPHGSCGDRPPLPAIHRILAR